MAITRWTIARIQRRLQIHIEWGDKMGKNRRFWNSAKSNNCSFLQYYDRLKELAISSIKWENLPNTIDERYLELMIYENGLSVFFRDDIIGYLALPAAVGNSYNVYMVPQVRNVYAPNGYQKRLTGENSVIIYNNMLHSLPDPIIRGYAMDLYDIDRSIIINAKSQKTPLFISCEESQQLTLKNTYMQYDGNMPVIFANKNLNPNDIKVMQTGAPFVADKLYNLKTKIWNEALTFLGITNLSDKKERLLTDEIAQNQGGVIASRYSRLVARQQAADEINRMFGLNIRVKYRSDVDIPLNVPGVESRAGGGPDE